MGKGNLADPGYGERIHHAEQDGQQKIDSQRWQELCHMVMISYARWKKPSSWSISQMPGNGAITPPTP